jgi:hypothetical protein
VLLDRIAPAFEACGAGLRERRLLLLGTRCLLLLGLLPGGRVLATALAARGHGTRGRAGAGVPHDPADDSAGVGPVAVVGGVAAGAAGGGFAGSNPVCSTAHL